ncbi:VOC family protein [Methylosinus sp. Ce-a6]|uniref:VOC family protein n=1 Tax=Methylosinus sp. Ce-a6 TaxID=2172005 RepID=UPI00135BC963|nr:VOC family protein [Methylosinus sp. Ce-a6]
MISASKIRPCLWFDREGEEAANFYVSLFPDSRVTGVSRYGEAGPGEPGAAMVVSFELCGLPFMALNGGPVYRLTEAFSLSVDCADQAEVDHYWEKLGEGGEYSRCGWLKDRYGLSWQITPRRLPQLLSGDDTAGAARAMRAMMGMAKLDVAALEAAYAGI